MVFYDYAQQGYEPEREGQPIERYEPYSHSNPKHIDPTKLDELTMEDYNLTPAAVKAYMFGLHVNDPETGKPLGDTFYLHAIESAISQVEQELDIAIIPRVETEHHDMYDTEFKSYMYTHVHKRPIIQVESLKLEFGGRPMYEYPGGWWKVYHLAGHIEVAPTPMQQGGSLHGNVMFSAGGLGLGGMSTGMTGRTFAPQMIHTAYVAGVLPRTKAGMNKEWEMPVTLEKLILKYAVKEIFQMWGRLVSTPGIASRTLSIDGVSESYSTTASAMYGVASADLAQIDTDIQGLLKTLRSYYGANFIAL